MAGFTLSPDIVPDKTIDQVAALLGKHPNTIRNWMVNEELPYYRIGGRVLFADADIEAWLKARRRVITAPPIAK